MTNAFVAGTFGFKGFTKREQARITTDTSFKKTVWNAPIVSDGTVVERKAKTAIREAQFERVEKWIRSVNK